MKTRSAVMRLNSGRYFFSSYCRDYFAARSLSTSAARRVNHKYNPVSSIKTYLSNTMFPDRMCVKPRRRWDSTRNHYMVRFYSSAIDGKKNVGEDSVANSEKEIIKSLDDAQNNRTENMENQKPCVEGGETKKKSPVLRRVTKFRDEFLKRVVPWEEITDSLDNSPYFINERTKSLLSECVGSRLKHKELTRDYSGRLFSSSGRILIQSIPGTVLYRNRLVGALAREMQVPMMVLDSSFLPPYNLSTEDGLDEEIASDSESEDESDDEDDSGTTAGTCKKCGSKYGSCENSSSSSKSEPVKTNCLLKEGDRVKYVGPTSTSTNETKRNLSTGQRGEVQQVNGDKVAVIFSMSDLPTKETDPQPSLSWLDVEHVRHDCDAKMHDCYISMGVLCEVLKSQQPLILYLPDSFRWLPSSASKEARQEFFNYTKKMFGRLTGRVVIICGEDRCEPVSKWENYPASLKKLIKELSPTRRRRDDGADNLFTNVVYIKPPEEEDLMKTFCEKIEEDRRMVICRSNSNEMQKVLKEHGIFCTDLDQVKTEDVILTKLKAEKIIGWATNHHLSSCRSPPLEEEQFHVPHESLKIAVSRLKEQETEFEKQPKKSVKDLAEGEYEEEIVSAVIRPDEIGVKFDDVGALDDVKKVLNELVILPMKRPELFSHGNLLRPCKGLLLFGPPGTGKTLIAKALATEAGANFINVTSASITTKHCGEDEKLVRGLFSFAAKLAPAIIFVDEVDSLLGARGGDTEHESTRAMRDEFMICWDGLKSNDRQRILVIGATNRPFDLDDAAIRRMPRRIYVDLPDVENRSKILKLLLAKENLESGFSFEQLAEATDSYSGSDLKNLCVAAAYRPVEELLQEESKGDKVDGAPSLRPLKLDDFIRSKTTVGPSVLYDSTSMIKLREWAEKYHVPREKKSVKDLAMGEFECSFVSAVVCPDEIGVKFDDVGALEDVKKVLNEVVILPMKRPELFSRGNLLRPCKGLLLFGPPGTGKTLIAKALATEAGANFINITSASITSKWYGEDEKYVRALFSLAAKLAPVIIFVDEVDSILGARGGRTEHEATRRIRNEFMASWDGLNSKDSQRILIMGATNRPFDLDDAVIRRMPRRIHVDLPDVQNRLKILKVLLAQENLESGFSFEQLAEDTDSYSGSDLKNLCVAAAHRPVQELLQEERKGNKVDGAPSLRPLKLDDFVRSKATVGPSVSYDAASMIELRKWNEQYGEGGSRRKSPFGF